jgi:hypothetical protein
VRVGGAWQEDPCGHEDHHRNGESVPQHTVTLSPLTTDK